MIVWAPEDQPSDQDIDRVLDEFEQTAWAGLERSTEFSIVANNLLDKAYLSAITENAAWLGAPRTVSMTATVSF